MSAKQRADLPEKICAFCARRFTWRKKWESCWDEVRMCSDACRRNARNKRLRELEERIRVAMLELLEARGPDKTICPSEVARATCPEDSWRDAMESVRRVARRLVGEGRIEFLQRGRLVDPTAARGALRLRLRGK